MTSKRKSHRSANVVVFHGTKYWTPTAIIRARSIEYMIGRGSTARDAIANAKRQMTYLNDFSNRALLEGVMLQAQRSGAFSPFVSTSKHRHVARSFALSGGSPGFILTIQGPQNAFYDFNKIRENCGIPPPPEFEWLAELGIPLQIRAPFAVIQVDEVRDVVEVKTKVYSTHKAKKK